MFKSKAPEKDQNAATNVAEVVGRTVQQQYSVVVQPPPMREPTTDAVPRSCIGSGMSIVGNIECDGPAQVSGEIKGYGAGAADHDFRVENRKTGAGVRQRGDLPISKVVFWSIRTTVCPEAYVHLRVEPGKESKWRIQYEFYTL